MKKVFMATLVAATALFSACESGVSAPKPSLSSDIDTLSYEMGMVMAPRAEEISGMLANVGSDSAFVNEFLKGYMEGMKSADDKKKMAYNMGIQAGMQMKMQLPMMEQQVFQGDSTKKVSIKDFLAGYLDYAFDKVVLTEGDSVMDKTAANKHVLSYVFSKFKKESADFMAKKATEADVKKMSDGILYKEIKTTRTAEHCAATDSVQVEYEGKLPNGQVFDSSNGNPVTFSLKNVIKGWQVAIPQMPIGSTWEFYIPSELAYGEQGSGPIPPHSALTFKITLIKVVK